MKIIRHGVICAGGHSLRSYYGWPSVTRMEDGTLVVAASGDRFSHICPYGRTVMWTSTDNGNTWSDKTVIHDSPIDDRDAGVLAMDDGSLLVSWFTCDTRTYEKAVRSLPSPENDLAWTTVRGWTDGLMKDHLGAYVMKGRLGGDWEDPIEIGITTPHGPIRTPDGKLLFFGKAFSVSDGPARKMRGADHPSKADGKERSMEQPIVCAVSADGGRNWETAGYVDKTGGFDNANLHEPYAVFLPDGSILGIIRTQWSPGNKFHRPFSMAQTVSKDGGRTWSELRPIDVSGSPPHLLLHSSGVLILTYGYRAASEGGPDVGSGQRVLLSSDYGESWSDPLILREDGPDGDLGYPETVELGDGTLLTVYYQKQAAGEKTSILYTAWSL